MSGIPKPQEIYRHFKGNLYRIVTIAKHSETGEQLVIYQALYGDYQVYARPLSMFMEKVDRDKYPDAGQEYRFELQQELAATQVREQEIPKAPSAEEQALAGIDPLVLEFLDADTYDKRLNILAALHHRITDDMLNIMSMAVDIELGDGNVEKRYEEFKNCLLTFEKYESSRLR